MEECLSRTSSWMQCYQKSDGFVVVVVVVVVVVKISNFSIDSLFYFVHQNICTVWINPRA